VNPPSTFVATDGDGYELSMGRWSRRLAGPFLDFAGCAAGGSILEAGCGPGHLSHTILERTSASEVRAIDFAPAYIDFARKRSHDSRIVFDVGDACALRFADQVFDAALSMLVLHFVPEAERAVAEMRRVVRPGGVVAAAVWDVRGGCVANRMFFDTAAVLDPKARDLRAGNFTRPMTRPGELLQAWRAAGLHEVSEVSLGIRMEFASFADYWAPYEGKEGPAAQFVSGLAEPERLRLMNSVRAAYLDGEADGPRSYAALAWAVRGIVPHQP